MTIAQDWPVTRPLALGWGTLVVLVLGFGGWAALTPIAGAVVATGQVDVDQGRQIVQHTDGGRLESILIAEGSHVDAGQVLLRLDGAALQSDLALVDAQLNEQLAQRSRLEAERDDAAQITFAAALTDIATRQTGALQLIQTQRRLFDARAESFRAQTDQLDRRRDQIGEQVRGLTAQIAATARQKVVTDQELARQKRLLDRGLTIAPRVASLDAESARLAGALASQQAAKAEAESRATEAALARLQLAADRREGALAELRDVTSQQAESTERARALRQKIDLLAIRAPVSGTVLGLQVTSAGAVLRPAEPALYIVPDDRPFVVTAKVLPADIDAVGPGQPAELRILAYDSHQTPDLMGRVTTVSADAFVDQTRGISYFRVQIAIPPDEAKKLLPNRLLPGMPAEVFLRTSDRTPLSYLLLPVESLFRRAFRDG